MDGRLKGVLSQIETIKPGARLLAVSKQQPLASILEAYQAGQRHFGENYAQELCEKASQLPSDIKWHFIGALQSNKLRSLLSIPNLWAIETLDSIKHADQMDRLCQEMHRSIRVYIQVNTSGEPQKHGCEPGDLSQLVMHVKDKANLQLAGLMTIGAVNDSRGAFEMLRQLRDAVCTGADLSMGMSADWQLALEMGSDQVRLGTLIFGERPPK